MNQDYKYFIDTNILVYASLKDYEKEKHIKSYNVLNKLSENNNQIFISTQILREFYAVVTNKNYLKNPLNPNNANKQVKYFISQFNTLDINEITISILLSLTSKYKIIGQKVHDTTIAASMLSNNIENIITFNKGDFKTFQEINVFLPDDILNK